jgi:hypothetical protein
MVYLCAMILYESSLYECFPKRINSNIWELIIW